ncbi:UvrABC system protein C, partial [Haemophilus influenzae]
LLMVEKGN